MARSVKRLIRQNSADVAMAIIILIWGFHFIVMKQGVDAVPPMTYNALRFLIGTPIILAIMIRRGVSFRLSRYDMRWVVATTLMGMILYQVCFSIGLKYTTSTNSALLVSTMPAWTALISMFMGRVRVRRAMLVGLAITFTGVVLVILGTSATGLSLSHNDLIGSALLLLGAITSALASIYTKPLVDRLGGLAVATWSYLLTSVALTLMAGPGLFHASIPLRIWPNVLYSGLLSSVAGFLVWNYALRVIGPTRATSYHNFTPIVAAVAGVVVLGEPLTVGLLLGGVLTLLGVVIVRRNTFIRPPDALMERPGESDRAVPSTASRPLGRV